MVVYSGLGLSKEESCRDECWSNSASQGIPRVAKSYGSIASVYYYYIKYIQVERLFIHFQEFLRNKIVKLILKIEYESS